MIRTHIYKRNAKLCLLNYPFNPQVIQLNYEIDALEIDSSLLSRLGFTINNHRCRRKICRARFDSH